MLDVRKPTLGFLVFALALGIASGGAETLTCSKADFKVLIDVGHMPDAPGATSARRHTELEFNLQLSGLIEERLKALGYSRTARWISPPHVSMAERVAAENAERPDLLVSIHHDSVQPIYLHHWTFEGADALYSDHAQGWSLFVSRANPRLARSLRLARAIADRLLASGLQFSTHHAESIRGEGRPFLEAQLGIYDYERLFVVAHSRAPAVLLEAGVIVNPSEETALLSPSRQQATAAAVVGAIDAYCDDAK